MLAIVLTWFFQGDILKVKFKVSVAEKNHVLFLNFMDKLVMTLDFRHSKLETTEKQ